MGVGLAAVIKGVEIGHRAGREHSLVLAAKWLYPKGSTERNPSSWRRVSLSTLILQRVSSIITSDCSSRSFSMSAAFSSMNTAVCRRVTVGPQIGQQLLHIFQIMLRVHHLLDVITTEAKPVAPVGVLNDPVLFRRSTSRL